jgi:hypothetical protein
LSWGILFGCKSLFEVFERECFSNNLITRNTSIMMSKTGSVRRGVVATDLLEERAKCAFNQEELRTVLAGGELRL